MFIQLYFTYIHLSPHVCVVSSKPEDTPIRSNRSKSIEDVQRQMVRTYVTSTGAPRTDFPDPKVSRIILLVWACLRKLGRGSLDHSLLVFHKNNRFRKTVKRAVKSKYPSIPSQPFSINGISNSDTHESILSNEVSRLVRSPDFRG